MSAPRIGLTTYARNEDDRFTLPVQYVDAVRRAGGVPFLLPPGASELEPWLDVLDGVILTGGGDLDPALWGGAPHESVYSTDADRDRDELGLARHLVDSDMPGLCVCRGLQVLNVALGGTLITHLPDVVTGDIDHRNADAGPTPHALRTQDSAQLTKLLGSDSFEAASWHHQAIANPAPDVEVVAWAPDDVIEAVEIKRRPQLLAVQWHPELTAASDPIQQRLFDLLVEWATAHRRTRTS